MTEERAIIPLDELIYLKFELEIFKNEFFLSNNVFKRAPVPPVRFSTLMSCIFIP